MILDKKQIQAVFLFEFKMGHKVVEATHNINTAFGPGTANKCTVSGGSRSSAKRTRALSMRSIAAGHWRLTVTSWEQRRSSPSYNCMSAVLRESLIRVRLCATPWTVALQAPLSMGILQARILEWFAMPSSRGSSQPRGQTQVSCTAGGFFTIWATNCMGEAAKELNVSLFMFIRHLKQIGKVKKAQ